MPGTPYHQLARLLAIGFVAVMLAIHESSVITLLHCFVMVRIAHRGLPSQSLVVIQKGRVGTQMLSSSKARNPLDLNGSDFSTLMKDVVHLLAEFLDHLPNAPFIQHADRFALLRDPFMRPAPSESGRPLRELLEIISRAAEQRSNTASGSAIGAPFPEATRFLSRSRSYLRRSQPLHRLEVGAPAMVAMEADVLRWMADLLGLPPTAAGILTSGGSMAVFSAIVCARSTKLPGDFRRGVIYATNQTHHALAKAVRLAGFPDDALQLVAVDSNCAWMSAH